MYANNLSNNNTNTNTNTCLINNQQLILLQQQHIKNLSIIKAFTFYAPTIQNDLTALSLENISAKYKDAADSSVNFITNRSNLKDNLQSTFNELKHLISNLREGYLSLKLSISNTESSLSELSTACKETKDIKESTSEVKKLLNLVLDLEPLDLLYKQRIELEAISVELEQRKVSLLGVLKDKDFAYTANQELNNFKSTVLSNEKALCDNLKKDLEILTERKASLENELLQLRNKFDSDNKIMITEELSEQMFNSDIDMTEMIAVRCLAREMIDQIEKKNVEMKIALKDLSFMEIENNKLKFKETLLFTPLSKQSLENLDQIESLLQPQLPISFSVCSQEQSHYSFNNTRKAKLSTTTAKKDYRASLNKKTRDLNDLCYSNDSLQLDSNFKLSNNKQSNYHFQDENENNDIYPQETEINSKNKSKSISDNFIKNIIYLGFYMCLGTSNLKRSLAKLDDEYKSLTNSKFFVQNSNL